MIWKILISSFQNPEIGRIFGRHPTVFTKQDTVLIFYEELSGIYRLPSDFCNNGSKFDINVGE